MKIIQKNNLHHEYDTRLKLFFFGNMMREINNIAILIFCSINSTWQNTLKKKKTDNLDQFWNGFTL